MSSETDEMDDFAVVQRTKRCEWTEEGESERAREREKREFHLINEGDSDE